MLDRKLENARGNTYFFFILLSADPGMISAETMAELEARRLLYILGVRERRRAAQIAFPAQLLIPILHQSDLTM